MSLMTTVFFVGVILLIIIIFLGLVVLMSNPKNKINIMFFVMTVYITLWVLSYVLSVSPDYSSVLMLRITNSMGLLGAFSFFQFSIEYPKRIFTRMVILTKVLPMLLVMMFVPIIIFTTFVVTGAEAKGNTIVPVMGEMGILLFGINTVFLLIGSITLMYKYFFVYRKNFSEKSNLKIVVLGFATTAVLLSLMNVLVFFAKDANLLIDALTPFSTIVFVAFTSYGILKDGLFDVRMAVVRSVTYAQVVATLAGLYVFLTFVLSSLFGFVGSSPIELAINIAITLSLVFLFQPLRRFFDKITNKIFYKDNYDTDEFFGRVNKILAITTDLKDLLKDASIEINKTLKGSRSSLYVLTDNGKIVSGGVDDKSTIDDTDLINLFSYASNQGKIIIRGLMSENALIKKLLSSNKIEIVLPLMKDRKLIGLFLMGENMSSNYTNRDVSVLETISNGLIVAILNALAVQEIRDFNITLRKKIDEATKELRVKNAMLKKLDKAKDEFVSMASHQLRTPLTSVKGYLSMVVDGDAGKVTSQQKELLSQAYTSNERMVDLVNDFLNVSRIQTGKFILDKKPIDLSKLVDEEVKGLAQNASKRQIKLEYDAPKDFPTIDIDEGKVRQVVMNFVDNAIYYSNTESSIKIELSIEKNKAIFTVKDTGIGVPASEQAGLFAKFYRASNAKKQRPDGTGVGLYLAKKIVTDHGGEIIFETVEGKGSTFGFSLPVK